MKFVVAFRGVLLAMRHERSCWVHLVGTIAMIVAGAFFRVTSTEWCLLVLSAALVWTSELLNTAIERISELVEPKPDPRVAALLDISAGAVLFAAMGAIVIGAIIFLPRAIAIISPILAR